MAIVHTPTELDARDEIRPVFDAVKGMLTFVPRPTQMLGASPARAGGTS